MFEIPLEYVAFFAIILGVIGRSYFPYLRKTEQVPKGEEFDFEIRYIVTAIFSGLVTAIFVFPLFVFPEGGTMLNVFISGFIFAWGANDVTNRVAHSTSTPVNGTTKTPTTTVVTTPIMNFAPGKP